MSGVGLTRLGQLAFLLVPVPGGRVHMGDQAITDQPEVRRVLFARIAIMDTSNLSW